MKLTPLETAIFNASELAAGLAASCLIQDLIVKSEEASADAVDRTQANDVRVKALQESRHLNAMLNFIAEARAVLGISA